MNGYGYLWQEPTGQVLLRHPQHGKQLWELITPNPETPSTCVLTGQQLQPGWLAYQPTDQTAPNAADRIGELGIRSLIGYTGKDPGK